MKKYLFFFLAVAFAATATAGVTVVKTDSTVTISNGVLERSMILQNGKFATQKMSLPQQGGHNFIDFASPEFGFLANGVAYDGASGWEIVEAREYNHANEGVAVAVRLKSTSGCPLDVVLHYIMYPGTTAMRKNIDFLSTSMRDVMLEAVDVEKLILSYNGIIFSSYGRQKHLATYRGDHDDALVMVHDYWMNGGMLLANEAPGVLKKVTFSTTLRDVAVGLSDKESQYPFRKYIAARTQWKAPSVVSLPYLETADPWQVMNGAYAEFQRKYSGYAIYDNPERRLTFMYNNYVPFNGDFDQTQTLDLIDAAAECGIREFTIDCGWYSCKYDTDGVQNWMNSCGDWLPHPRKFPDGMEPVFDRMREKGIKPGLWVSVATASEWSEVFRSYPQWSSRDKEGKAVNFHDQGCELLRTMCFGTDWKHYIKESLRAMAIDWGVRYFKLDLAAATSAYIYETERSGCYAADHSGHKDHAESYIAIYEEMFRLFDELHEEFPDLYIDCTFETEGKMQAIDLGFRLHADGNWLTNFAEPYPTGNFRIRNLAWWRSPAMPASSMLIGNRRLDSPEAIDELRTMMGTFPIMLGDLRAIPAEKRAEIKQWSEWITALREKYEYDIFRSDLPGFGEPAEGSWDAYARINTDTKRGGIIGIFRQGAPDGRRTVLVPGLIPEGRYSITGDPSSDFAALQMTGSELAEKGFEVEISEKYAGRLFEIELVK